MKDEWKSILYEYAEGYHEPLIRADSDALKRLVDDTSYMEYRNRTIRRYHRDRKRRAIRPQRCETHAKIVRADVTDDAVTAVLQLGMKLTYIQAGERHDEEKVTLETITMRRGPNGWRIVRVEPFAQERPAEAAYVGTHASGGQQTDAAAGSRPLLNTHLLYGWHSGPAPADSRKQPYNRLRAKQYADQYWNSHNPDFLSFEVDCTNYVSQCLLAGGAPMNYTGRRETGWWYQGRKAGREWWSYSWSVSHALHHYLMTSRSGLRAELVQSPYELDLGDVIIYDWDGDGRYQHSTIVTGFDAAGEPLVNAHTANSRARLWSYRDSPAWTEQTRYRFFHIADFF
jgi:hypothetical protein